VTQEGNAGRRASTARLGEQAVARLLESRGFTILERNLRIGRGEIDIVAARGDQVCLVEVKARRSLARGRPDEAVTPRKREQLRRLGRLYAAGDTSRRYRFDVASVTWDARGEPVVRYYENAFTLADPA
jgi:putative endonuclease